MIKIGDIIDNRYTVLSHLGTGGMAVVFECKDLINGNVVAVKIMKEELLDNPNMVKDFTHEVKASVAMSHENIVEVYEEGIWQNRPYLVLEYLNSQTLLDKLEYFTKFSIAEASQIMLQLLDAISCIHEHKILHRDIKPQNIYYLSNGIIKVADFGIASKVNETEQNKEIMGSIHYLAPEVLHSKKFGVSSDIYAAGITFFQLVTGVLPFDGTTSEIAEEQIKKECPKPSMIVSSIPKDLDYIILKSVNKNPSLRYKNAVEFKKDLMTFLQGKKLKHSFFERFF